MWQSDPQAQGAQPGAFVAHHRKPLRGGQDSAPELQSVPDKHITPLYIPML